MKILKIMLVLAVLAAVFSGCTSTDDRGVTISKGFFGQNCETMQQYLS